MRAAADLTVRRGRRRMLGTGLFAATALGLVVGAAPAAHAAAGDPCHAYAGASRADGSVYDVDVAGKTSTAMLNAGYPYEMVMSPDGRTLFVADGYDGVLVIPVAEPGSAHYLPVPGISTTIAITRDGKTLYVGGTDDRGTLTAVDVASGSVGNPMQLGATPSGIVLTPDGQTAYVATSNATFEIDLKDGATAPVGPGTIGSVALTPDGRTLFIAYPSVGWVLAVNTATRSPLGTVALKDPAAQLAVAADGKTVYATGQKLLSVINVATLAVASTIDVGSAVEAPAVSPDGRTVLVGTGTDVVPINVRARTVADPIHGFALGGDIVFAPDQAPVAELTVKVAEAGKPTTLDASASTVQCGSIVKYVWDFGDGKSATTTTPTTTHTYAKGGHYTVTVTETDSAGTSTKVVYTGAMVTNNGGPSATTTAHVVVPAAKPAAPTPTPNRPHPASDGGQLQVPAGQAAQAAVAAAPATTAAAATNGRRAHDQAAQATLADALVGAGLLLAMVLGGVGVARRH